MEHKPQHQKKAAMFFVVAFGIVILAISGVTTFSFFSTYFSAIFPQDMLGIELARLMAGGAGFILFDAAVVYWLYTFLNHAETPEQRGIALIMLVVTFIGAAGASVAQLGLSASGDVALDPATRQGIANISVWTVIVGVVANFGANIAYGRYSLASKQAVMEADRRDMVQQAEDEQARLLDGLIAQGVKELITAEAGALAQEQARRVVAAFRSREMAKYACAEPAANKGGETAGPYQVERHKAGGRPQVVGTAGTLEEAKRLISRQPSDAIYKVAYQGQVVYDTSRPTPPHNLRYELFHNGKRMGSGVSIEALKEMADEGPMGGYHEIVDTTSNAVVWSWGTRPTPAPTGGANGQSGYNYPKR